MRVMVLVKATQESEAGKLPDEQSLGEMGRFNEELAKAGVLLAGEGLKPSSAGVRMRFAKEQRTIIDGPFAGTHELVAGFWLWQVRSKQEAIDWLRRAPFREGEVEIRELFEAADFAASDPTGELLRREAELRRSIQAQQS